jgi:hypothetical protein
MTNESTIYAHAHEPFICVLELAERTNLPIPWLKRETEAGRLPCIRAGRRIRYDFSLVRIALLNNYREEATNEPR